MIYNIVFTNKNTYNQINWQDIKPLILSDNNGSDKAKFETKAKLAYNDKGMFFEYQCQDDKVNATMTGYNQPIYDEETVEFFFAQKGNPGRYLELEWNAIGGSFCAYVDNDLQGHTKLSFIEKNLLQSDITFVGTDWIIRGFIPKELFEGEFENEWTFNAYRIKRNIDNSMILMAFSPTIEENFHKPLKFAKLKFNN